MGSGAALIARTIDVLVQQHRAVLDRLEEVEAVTPSRPALKELLVFLQSEVEEHLVLEEEALFPVLARRPQLAAGPLAVMDAEHQELRALTTELAAALGTGASSDPGVAAARIAALLRAHIDKEDRVLFPLAAHLLSAAEREEVDARARVLERDRRPRGDHQ